jgi:hypothetical protein
MIDFPDKTVKHRIDKLFSIKVKNSLDSSAYSPHEEALPEGRDLKKCFNPLIITPCYF